MQTYTVQAGDTLSAIAARYQTSVEAIVERNSRVKNPDYIQVGWTLDIPKSDSATGGAFPSPKADPTDPTSESAVSSPCSECLVDVMHVTGSKDDQWCEALPETAAEELYGEIERVQSLSDEYRQLCAEVPVPSASDYESKILEHRRKKADWLQKAAEFGILEKSEPTEPEPILRTSERQKLEAKQAEVTQEIAFYESYRPFRMLSPGKIESDANSENENWKLLQSQKLDALKAEEASINSQLAALPREGSESEGHSAQRRPGNSESTSVSANGASEYKPFTGGVPADKMSGMGASASANNRRGKHGQNKIVELMLFNRGNRLSYVRKDFLRQLRTKHSLLSIRKTQTIASLLSGQPSSMRIEDLVDQVKSQIEEDRRKGKLGDVKLKLAEWTLDGKDAPEWVQFLQSEHKALWQTSLSNGQTAETTTMALDSEGHFMRFAATASSNVEGFDPASGKVDIGFAADASMSLIEGKVELKGYLPNEAGWDCRWTYIDANGKQAHQSFGKFRFEGQTVLSCFVGAKASGQAKVGVSGANLLLSSAPGIKSEASELGAGAKLSGNAFAGAEAGGELAGKLGWESPVVEKDRKPKFADLLELKASGLVAFGAGAGLDFEIKLDDLKNIEVHGSGRLVFGPGASGGFGTTISANKILQLCEFIFSALRSSDFRFLRNVNKDLFLMLSRAFTIALTQPAVVLSDILQTGYSGLEEAWRTNQLKRDRAERLAEKISSGEWQSSLRNGSGGNFSLADLPPEALGPCCHELTESFLLSREEVQERALVFMLSSVVSWRHFIEILEHMSIDGSKTNAMDSLARIQAMLDFGQQREFDRWIVKLHKPSFERSVSWTPVPADSKKKVLDQHLAALNRVSKESQRYWS